MHILIDVQGLQSASKYRGIGRSTLGMSKAIIRNAGRHKVSILLNGMFSLESIREVRQIYQDLLPMGEVYTFSAHGPVAAYDIANIERNRAAHISRDIAIAHINPDVVFVISFFEGHIDEYIVSIPDYPVKWHTVCVCHDLIPLLNPETYLSDVSFRQFYLKKLYEYERADAIFSISYSATEELKKYTTIDPSRIINISSAVEKKFRVLPLTPEQKYIFRERYHLPNTFIMTLAMIEPRKNIEALIKAYSELPKTLRDSYPMVLACKIHPIKLIKIKKLCSQYGLTQKQILFTGYLSDPDLIILYNLCNLFIFPSLHEGFGLPPLEAMSCGAPTLSSNTTSLPEVIGWSEAMFDPTNIKSMRDSILRALRDKFFYQKLKEHALIQAEKFSWDRTAHLALSGFEKIVAHQKKNIDIHQFTNRAIHHLTNEIILNQDTDRLGIAWAFAKNIFNKKTPKLCFDVTPIITSSLIESSDTLLKVCKRINLLIKNLVALTQSNYSIHIVYYLYNTGYRYAVFNPDNGVVFTSRKDIPVFFVHRDILLLVDLQDDMSSAQQEELDSLIRAGTRVLFWLSDDKLSDLLLKANQCVCLSETSGLRTMFYYADSIFCLSDNIVKGLQCLKKRWSNKIAMNMEVQIENLKSTIHLSKRDEISQLFSRLTSYEE